MFNLFKNKIIRYAVRSSQWTSIRKEFLSKHNKCEACGKKKDLEVHHIVPVHVDPSLELDQNNLITLCSNSCHILFGHLMDFKSWNPDVSIDCENIQTKIQNRIYK